MARVLSFLLRYFSNYYTLHRSDLAAQAAQAAPLDLDNYIIAPKGSFFQARMQRRFHFQIWSFSLVFPDFSQNIPKTIIFFVYFCLNEVRMFKKTF